MSNRPTEPPDGQDDPPDLRTALVAAIKLLHDVGQRLSDEDLGLRSRALRNALIRLRDHLDERREA